MRNFPSFIDAFMEYTKNVEAPEKFLRWSAISIVAGALERKVWTLYNMEHIYPNEYIMLIGPSGIAKKTTSTKPAIDLLGSVPQMGFMSTQLTAASLVKQLKDAGHDKRVMLDGVEYNNSSMYLYSSEASVTLKEMQGGGSTIELLTDFWDCAPGKWSNERYWSKETIGQGRQQIYNACLNMLACSTSEWLIKALGKDAVEGGFVSRILFVVQKGKADRVVEWSEDETHVVQDTALQEKLLEDLKVIAKLQGKFICTKAMKLRANEIKQQITADLDANKNTRLNNYYARKLWHVLKLTMIISASESNDLIATEKHIDRANELVTSLEADMLTVFGMAGDNPKLQSLVSFWNCIRHRKMLNWTEISKLAYKTADRRTMEEHLGLLIHMEKVKVAMINGISKYEVIDPTPLK
jgi:hypothetical protein